MSKFKSLFKNFLAWIRAKTAPGEFLCDSCLYDWDNACNNRERPNATKCKDYKKK